jgi:hypothetical protein
MTMRMVKRMRVMAVAKMTPIANENRHGLEELNLGAYLG